MTKFTHVLVSRGKVTSTFFTHGSNINRQRGSGCSPKFFTLLLFNVFSYNLCFTKLLETLLETFKNTILGENTFLKILTSYL